MQDGDESGEKSHAATPKKLADARRRGELPRSTDVNGAAALAGLALALATGGAALSEDAGSLLAGWLAGVGRGEGGPAVWGLILASLHATLALWLVPIAAVIVAVAAQRAFVFAPKKLRPQLARISPVTQAKQKYGWSGLFEFAKSAAKLVAVTLVAGLFVVARREQILASLAAEPRQLGWLMGALLVDFLLVSLAVVAGIAVVDYLWQRHNHLRRHRMTHKELRDEHKETEGDPHMKQARRHRGEEIARNRMLADVPKSDVVIVNPHHYAVALRWDRGSGRVPVCLAKGTDELAARIREQAAEAGVPLHRDPPTARALHASVEIGAEIRPEHYRAVAAAIRFAERMRAAALARGLS